MLDVIKGTIDVFEYMLDVIKGTVDVFKYMLDVIKGTVDVFQKIKNYMSNSQPWLTTQKKVKSMLFSLNFMFLTAVSWRAEFCHLGELGNKKNSSLSGTVVNRAYQISIQTTSTTRRFPKCRCIYSAPPSLLVLFVSSLSLFSSWHPFTSSTTWLIVLPFTTVLTYTNNNIVQT